MTKADLINAFSNIKHTLWFAGMLLVSACGGGGGGGEPPPPPAYSVNVSASGLDSTSAGVVLQNNGGDDLTINADGSYGFATGLGDGDAYNVSVFSAPGTQTCQLTNATGNIAAADVEVMLVCADKMWGTAELIESDDADAYRPQLAIDGNGNVVAVWYGSGGNWANVFDVSSRTWGTAQLIEFNDGSAGAPEINFDANGNAIAVWH